MMRIAGVMVFVLILTGCASFNSVYREFDIKDGTGALIDIKQRAIIASEIETDLGEQRVVVCAEPSPDALSAYAAEFAAEGGNGQVGAAIAAAAQETSAFVGLRTQSIQLLRDAFYRACEGYMAGALSEAQFDILSRRYQRYMVALLGIEQLTGAVRAPSVTLTTEGQANAARSLSSLRAELSAVEAQITAKEEAKKKEGADTAKLDMEIAELNKDKSAIQNGINNARGVTAGGSTSATVSNIGVPNTRSDQTIEKISETVGEIVQEVLNTDDLNAVCLAILSGSGGDNANQSRLEGRTLSKKDFGQLCEENIETIIANRQKIIEQRNTLYTAVSNYISNSNATPAEIIAILNALDGSFQNLDQNSDSAITVKNANQ